ncbi:MAG: 1-(5-phosphoribosyl)-5-[(5-phosphoribosylamino)methylideneamino]imidazole-4-carboxamide isomerase [bacterium]
MLIIPAIDLIKGECVRLYQGKEEEKTVFSSSPLEIARTWQNQGAELIHIVDLDGAFSGSPQNLSTVMQIVQDLDIPVELGGGIRTSAMARKLLESGIDRVILGTIAFFEPMQVKTLCREFPGRISVGIDTRDGMIAIHGWKNTTEAQALEFCRQIEDWGVRNIIFTDIRTDGTLQGPNIEAIRNMIEHIDIPLIASGGISSMDDLHNLAELEPLGLEGAIIGKAIYTGSIDLQEAVRLYQNNSADIRYAQGK